MKKSVITVLSVITIVVAIIIAVSVLTGCDTTASGIQADTQKTIVTADMLQERQPTPTDIDYSIPRYLLTRRAYFVNGQREKARTLPCPIADMPLGHIVLLTDSGSVVGKFIVEGMVISLNTYLTPDSEYYEIDADTSYRNNKWLADVDGTYGMNDDGIFFFTPDGKYMEWNGEYLYTDAPVEIKDPVLKVGE